jgi:uncharacterized membrane protein YfcA
MGGAALMTPFLVIVLGVRPVIAVGTDLIFAAVTKVVGAWMHWRERTVDLNSVLWLAAGSLPGGAAGVFMLRYLRIWNFDVDRWVREGIGIGLIVVALTLLARALHGKSLQVPKRLVIQYRKPATAVWGFLVGVVVGFTSLGSGSLIIPFLMVIYPLKSARAVGTDVFHAAILVAATGMLHAGAGHVDWSLLPLLLGGSIPGVMIGSYLAPRLPERPLRVGISLLLLVSGAKLV